jgi:hypothetical protein
VVNAGTPTLFSESNERTGKRRNRSKASLNRKKNGIEFAVFTFQN